MRKKILLVLVSIVITIPFLFFLKPAQSQNANDYYDKANTMLISGKYNEAISLYNQAIKQNPKYSDAYMGLGMAYKAQGDYEEAYVATSKAINLKPRYYQAYYNLGLILENLNKPDKAIIAYEKFLKEVPGADRFSDVKQRISILKKKIND